MSKKTSLNSESHRYILYLESLNLLIHPNMYCMLISSSICKIFMLKEVSMVLRDGSWNNDDK